MKRTNRDKLILKVFNEEINSLLHYYLEQIEILKQESMLNLIEQGKV